MLRFELHADAFLHHMVRNIVGSLVYVGAAGSRRAGSRSCSRAGTAALRRRRSARRACTSRPSIMMRRGTCPATLRLAARPDAAMNGHANARQNLRHHARRRWHCRGASRARRDRTRVLPGTPRCVSAGAGARDRRCAAALRDGRGLVRRSRAGRGARGAGRGAARSAAVPRRRNAGVLRSSAVRTCKAVPVKPGVDLLQYAGRYAGARGWLFDAFQPEGCPAAPVPRSIGPISRRTGPRPLILSGGLTPRTSDGGRAVRPWAVDVSSGVEATGEDGRPTKGIKSASKIAAFIREVRNADG